MRNIIFGIVTQKPQKIEQLLQDIRQFQNSLQKEQQTRTLVLVLVNSDISKEKLAQISKLHKNEFPIDLLFISKEQQQRDAEKGCFGQCFKLKQGIAPIIQTRTMLQRYLYDCLNTAGNSVGIVLDDDFRLIFDGAPNVPSRLVKQINNLKIAQHSGIDVVFGRIAGASPNPPLHGFQGVLFDVLENIKWLKTLDGKNVLPNRAAENQENKKRFPEYYYDLTRLHTEHLKTTFWIESDFEGETVAQAYERFVASIPKILVGENQTRMIETQVTRKRWFPSVNRGGITFILNKEALANTPNLGPSYKDISPRRSDMIWSIVNRDTFGLTMMQSDISLFHQGEIFVQEEDILTSFSFNERKVQAELLGSSLYKAMRESKKHSEILENTIFHLQNREQQLKESVGIIGQLAHQILEVTGEKSIHQTMKHILNIVESFPESMEILSVRNSIQEFLLNLEVTIEEYQYAVKNVKPVWLIEEIEKLEDLSQEKVALLSRFVHCGLPSKYGPIDHYCLDTERLSLVMKGRLPDIKKEPIIRIHSSCIFSEIFKATDCDCAEQLDQTLQLLQKHEAGELCIFYLQQEGRGHGLFHKTKIIDAMNRKHINTYEACSHLELENDRREFPEVIQFLKEKGIKSVQLISNNPYKKSYLEKEGIKCQLIPTVPTIHADNFDYLYSKKQQGHLLEVSKYTDIQFYRSQDAYGWLSNFSDSPIIVDDETFPTVEHFYQASKFVNDDIRLVIQRASYPQEAKALAKLNKHKRLANWASQKEAVMYRGLQAKFGQNPVLQERLLNTGMRRLVERSPTDSYWGDGEDGQGQNRLGELLMKLREEFRNQA